MGERIRCILIVGRRKVYNLDSITLNDINTLIDKGDCFTLATGLESSEYDSIESNLSESEAISNESSVHEKYILGE